MAKNYRTLAGAGTLLVLLSFLFISVAGIFLIGGCNGGQGASGGGDTREGAGPPGEGYGPGETGPRGSQGQGAWGQGGDPGDGLPPDHCYLEEQLELYLEHGGEMAPAFQLYREILAVQLAYLDRINISTSLTEAEINDCLRGQEPLLGLQELEIDPGLFREILLSICQVILRNHPGAPGALLGLPEAQEFQEGNLPGFLQEIMKLDRPQLEDYFQETGLTGRSGLEGDLIAYALYSSLNPFYNSYMRAVSSITDFSIWRDGCCPVCGHAAAMAKHREEDGARILECGQCQAQWNYPRVECPFCDNNDYNRLRYFYVPGERFRQVHVCEECKGYIKTVDTREMDREAFLGLEAIATAYLDALAVQEGYKCPGGHPFFFPF